LAATIAALREGWPRKRVVVAFQPHRYTRTRDLLHEFATAFNDADVLLVTDVYAAGEEPIPGADAAALVSAVRACGHRDVTHVPRAELARAARERVRPGDLVLTLGAGDVTAVGPELLALLSA
jgi:UDP-N-acetylmuramate--alanine ligase